MAVRLLAVLFISSLSLGCGGSNPVGSSPTSPTTTQAPPVSPTPLTEFTYDFDSSIDAADVSAIRGGIDSGRDYLQRTFGWTPTRTVNVSVRADGESGTTTASAGATVLIVHTRSPGWVGAIGTKGKILLHELVHVMQQQAGWSGGQTWFIEGTAELIGFRGSLIEGGKLTESQARSCHVWNVSKFGSAMGTLESYATKNGDGATYSLFYLAADRLLARSDLQAFARSRAFELNFGLTLQDFYSEFEGYRATLQLPTRYECIP